MASSKIPTKKAKLSKAPNKQRVWNRMQISGLFLWVVVCSNVFRSSWAGDDWPNSQEPYLILWRYGKISLGSVYAEAMHWNNQWMIIAGRFYPLAWIETRYAFSYLRSLWQYKLLESAMLFIAGLLVVFLIYLLSGSKRIELYSLFFLPVFIQFRNDFDPHLAFGFMVESVVIKVSLAGIFAFYAGTTNSKTKSTLFAFFSGALLFAGCCTYEYAFLLIPSVLILLLTGYYRSNPSADFKSMLRTKSLAAGIILFFWASYAVYVFGFLRAKAVAISGAYVLSVSWKSIPVFVSQIFSPLPLVNYMGTDFPGNFNNSHFVAILGGIVVISLFSYFIRSFNRLADKELTSGENCVPVLKKYPRIHLYLFGLSFVITPSFMLAIQPTWWGRATIVHSYLGILLGELGYVVIAATVFDAWIVSTIHNKNSNKLLAVKSR